MNLVAILMDDIETARNARAECAKLAEEQMLTIEDAVVVYKENDEVKLDQAVNLTAAGAMGGAWWGMLIGAIAGVATGGTGLVLAGLAGGAAGGAVSGWMSDAGISDEMMKETAAALDGGKAILFIAARTGAPDKVLERLKPFGGKVIKSNLTEDADKKINAILSGDTA